MLEHMAEEAAHFMEAKREEEEETGIPHPPVTYDLPLSPTS
jgi:hypothetical protein